MTSILRKIGFFTAFIIPLLIVTGYFIGGWGNYLTIAFSFIFLPVIDQFCGVDTANVPENAVQKVSNDYFYRFVTYIWTFFQIGFLAWGCYVITAGKINTLTEWIGFVLSFSLMTGGIGITVAHELGHKKEKIERFYSKLLLMTVSYMHFYIEHNRGHHVLVATPDDPATARKNESFYAFWFRSVFGGYVHAWRIENDRVNRKHGHWIHSSNEMIWFTFLPFLLCLILTAGVSVMVNRIAWEVPVFFFAQSFLAFTLLELVNYVEHYGIMRRELSPGKYERVNPLHSWNASHLLSNFFLFQLQRHSDHHAYAHKRYQVLNHYEESPQLPYGYPTMILLALVPPLWFSMMNQRLDQWKSAVLA
jgi:alkane 1-monooxygenase